MSEYEVPEGMLDAACSHYSKDDEFREGARVMLEAALRWLSENPIVPTDEQCQILWHVPYERGHLYPQIRAIAIEWQRRMFLKPKPKVPEEIQNLRAPMREGTIHMEPDELDRRLSEAFRRGEKKGKEQH